MLRLWHILCWPLKWLLLLPILFYQQFITPYTPPSCRFTPTCSEYARQAILRHGPFRGLYLAVRRLLRCHPWGGSGYDPVPLLLLLLIIPLRVDASAQPGAEGQATRHYAQMRKMSVPQLVEKGCYYINATLRPDSAMLCFSLAANARYRQTTDSTAAAASTAALNLMGQVAKDFYHNYQTAYTCFMQAEEEAIKRGQTSLLPVIHNNMASMELLNTVNNTDSQLALKALRSYKQAFHEAYDHRQTSVLPMICSNLATTAMGWHLTDSVKAELQDYLALPSAQDADPHRRYLCQAVLAYGSKDYSEALRLFQLSCDNVRGENSKVKSTHLISAHNLTVQMLLEQHREEEALLVAEQLITLAHEYDNSIALNDIYELLYNYYQQKPDPAKAEQYELLHLREKDIIMNQGGLADIDKLKFLYEIEQMGLEARELAQRHSMQTRILYGLVVFLLIILVMMILLFRQYRMLKEKNRQLYLNSLEKEDAKPRPKYQSHVMNDQSKSELLHRIFIVMENSQDIYSNSFSLQRLAELVDANPNYVSQVINEHYGRTFNSLLNEYRVKEACRRMNDKDRFGHLTLEGIAQSVGIKSRTNFSAVFKQQTGLTPSEYQRQARLQQR